MSKPEMILIDKPRPHTTVITLNRPERMNSMAFELMVPLHEAFAAVAADNDTTCVVLTGEGRGFCSGADTRDGAPPPNIDGLTLTRIATKAMTVLADLVPAMQRMPQPVICAVNGAAIGGGLCLTLGADIRIAGESAYFRAAGINNGLTATELGLSFLLPRAIGSSRAFEIMLSGRDIDAHEAAAMGLVSRIVPDADLLESALDLADQINGWSTQGVALDQAHDVGRARDVQPAGRDRAGEPHATVRAPDDAELRGGRPRPTRGPPTELRGLTDSLRPPNEETRDGN